MQNAEFLAFINTSTTKGGAVYNIKTQNVSRQARDILQKSQFKALAKAHINQNIVQAFKSNAQFKEKLLQVMHELNITVVE